MVLANGVFQCVRCSSGWECSLIKSFFFSSSFSHTLLPFGRRVCVSYSVQWNLLNMTFKPPSMPMFGRGLRVEEGLLLGRWVVTVGDDTHLKQQSVILTWYLNMVLLKPRNNTFFHGVKTKPRVTNIILRYKFYCASSTTKGFS